MLPVALTVRKPLLQPVMPLLPLQLTKIFFGRALSKMHSKRSYWVWPRSKQLFSCRKWKVLLDQIQTRSAVKVLQYDIVNETIKNKNITLLCKLCLVGKKAQLQIIHVKNEVPHRFFTKMTIIITSFLLGLLYQKSVLNELTSHSLIQT